MLLMLLWLLLPLPILCSLVLPYAVFAPFAFTLC
jgi:hypothetical protein